jgi:LCP family protein required for cell wall assembly
MKIHKIRFSLKRLATILLLAVLVPGSWYGYNFYRVASAVTGNNNPLQLVSAFTPATLQATNNRTNILIAGYSNDDVGHQGAELTDSIMILSIDQTNKSATIISVPRDLYVDVPGYGYSKINAVFEYGEAENFSVTGYASGGMGLLEKTVETVTGIHSNYEALINYTAFKSLVDAVGGINVSINSTNSAGLYDPNTNLKLVNGTVTLNGQEALNLARARGDGYGSYGFINGDFDRSSHQQLILAAVAAKVSSGLSLAEVTQLAGALGSNVKTDLKLNEIKTLYGISKNIPTRSINNVTFNNVNGTNLLVSYTTPNGQSALVPSSSINDYTALRAALATQLSTAKPSQ